MAELAELDDFAAEVEAEPPSPAAKKTARLLLAEITRIVPRYYAVSPWEKGAVVVQSSGGKGHRVSVYCEADGGASFYVTRPGRGTEKVYYPPESALPAKPVIQALKELPQ